MTALVAPVRTTIRPLSRIELPQCVPFARKFHTELKLPGEFKASVFLQNWQTFYDRYQATVLGLFKDGVFVGGLGALIVPDLLDGRLTCNEMFWFVDETQRTGLGGIRLLKAFHAWAEEHGAVETRMVHLHASVHSEQLQRVYDKFGYEEIETCYRKPLKETASWQS